MLLSADGRVGGAKLERLGTLTDCARDTTDAEREDAHAVSQPGAQRGA
jgi:hypothetical protein